MSRTADQVPDGQAGDSAAVLREEACSRATLRRVAAMLDLPPDGVMAFGALPRGWHFVLLAADTPRSALRGDGFPGLGVPMPDLGLPRLMLGGRSVAFHADIPIGAAVQRSSAVRSIVRKATSSGPMAVVTLAHELRIDSVVLPAVAETQTYLLLPARPLGGQAAEATPPAAPLRAAHMKTVVPDATLLFQYSALGFNSHRIHIDLDHARDVEGFPDLVVNGGLSTLLLTEFLRHDLGLTPAALTVRHVAPLYCNRAVTLTAEPAQDPAQARWLLKAFDDQHRLAVDMEVTVQ
jgi:3-methylfumaryl-CoA hydratase